MESVDLLIMILPAFEEEFPMDTCSTNLIIPTYPYWRYEEMPVKVKVVLISCFSKNITENFPAFRNDTQTIF